MQQEKMTLDERSEAESDLMIQEMVEHINCACEEIQFLSESGAGPLDIREYLKEAYASGWELGFRRGGRMLLILFRRKIRKLAIPSLILFLVQLSLNITLLALLLSS